MIIKRIKTIFYVSKIFRRLGLVDKEKYRAYLNVLSVIIHDEELMQKQASLINKIELSYQNRRNTVRVIVYFKDRKKYEFDLNKWDYTIPIDKQYSLDTIKRSLCMIFGDTKRYGIKYNLINRKKASSI